MKLNKKQIENLKQAIYGIIGLMILSGTSLIGLGLYALIVWEKRFEPLYSVTTVDYQVLLIVMFVVSGLGVLIGVEIQEYAQHKKVEEALDRVQEQEIRQSRKKEED